MRVLKSLAEAKIGQRLEFTYYGGENPGTIRTVDVTAVEDDRIRGMDLEKDEPRQYLFYKAARIKVVIECLRLTPELEAEHLVKQEAPTESLPTHRTRRLPLSFPAARDLLHQQIDSLNGEDLAEVLGEVQGEDRARFDAESGVVIMERDVLIPHCEVSEKTLNGAACIDWVNEDGERFTTTFLHEGRKLHLMQDTTEVSAETLIKGIAQHLGLTIS